MLNGNFSEDSTVIYVRVQHSVHTLRDNIQTLISIIRCVSVVLVSDPLVVLRHSSANVWSTDSRPEIDPPFNGIKDS